MIRGRWLFIALVTLLGLYIFWEVVDLVMPPSARHAAPHSFSGRVNGHRGVFEVLDALGHPIERGMDFFARPGHAADPASTRVLILEPTLVRMDRENELVAEAVAWVHAGGQLVIVSRELDLLDSIRRRASPQPGEPFYNHEQLERYFGEKGLVKSLGLENLRVRYEHEEERVTPWYERDVVRLTRINFEEPEWPYALHAEGTLADAAEDAATVMLPIDEPRGFAGSDIDRADGVIEAEHEDGHRYPIALDFAIGEGRVLLCSEPALFNNFGLTMADNGVLAVRLAAGDGDRALILDEYFHGAMPIGRPFAIFGVFPYGLIALSILLATAVTVWHAGARFGPPLADPPPSRRSIVEYVDAMARMFVRSGQHRFVLHACMEGVLDDIRTELFLPHGAAHERVLHALERRDPDRAARLHTALEEAKQWLRGDARLTRHALAELQGRLEACRTPRALSPQLRIASARSTAGR